MDENRFSAQLQSGVTVQMFDKLRTKVEELQFKIRDMVDRVECVELYRGNIERIEFDIVKIDRNFETNI